MKKYQWDQLGVALMKWVMHKSTVQLKVQNRNQKRKNSAVVIAKE